MYTTHPSRAAADTDPFVLYSRSLHDYTLKLWTESIRMSEARSRGQASSKGTKRQGGAQSTDGKTAVQKAAPPKAA